ncbi:MAG: thiamine phosphate synthase [Clostridia bacterium]|nr:thiamine phosphate synthase [Clostridia bacterium]
MKFKNRDLNLYLVTDRSWLGARTLESDVECALKNGVSFLQLREKAVDDPTFLEYALSMKALAEKYRVPFVINDNVAIALESNADGVHIGQSDMPVAQVREKIGVNKILGVSVRTVAEALDAEEKGADYLGVGAVFSTSTKLDAADVTYEELTRICQAVAIPVVAIGGIHGGNVEQLKGSGIFGVAVVSAILAQKDISEATSTLSKLCQAIF